MEITKYLRAVFLLALIVVNGCTVTGSPLSISEKSAGKWELGMQYSMAVNDSKEYNYTLREGIDREEGYQYRVVSVWEESEDNPIATFVLSDNHEIITITVFDNRFVTEGGIHVGSTVSDLLKAYLVYKVVDRGQPILVPKEEKVEFFLPPSFPKSLEGKVNGIRIGIER